MKRVIDLLWSFYCCLPLSNQVWSKLLSIISLISGKSVAVFFDETSKIFRVQDKNDELWVARRSRIRLFHRGVLGRLRYLEDSYCVPEGVVGTNDLVVDCGANIGEFSRAMEMRGASVHAFEPDPQEFFALKRNLRNKGSKAHEMALWSKSGNLFFSRANDNGDSWVSENNQVDGSEIFVAGTTLDEWAASNLSEEQSISLLKLEAEGGEMEVVRGGRATIPRIKYICADLGEPSTTGPTSVPEVVNVLLYSGFEVVSFQKARCMTVFRNTRLTQAPR